MRVIAWCASDRVLVQVVVDDETGEQAVRLHDLALDDAPAPAVEQRRSVQA